MNQLVKRIFLLSIFFISISTYAQDFDIDSSYLESLPDGVRNDVLSEIKGRKDQESDIYRRSSSMIKKRGSSEDVEDANIEYQDYLNYVSEQKRLRNLNVERFGLNIFDAMQSSFMPINEPNIDSSYIFRLW